MDRYYSDTLQKALRLLYFQADPKKFPEGVVLLQQAVDSGEPDAYYFLARCYAWEDGGVKCNERKAIELSREGIRRGSDLCVLGAERMDELKGDVKAAMQRTLEESFQAVLKVAQDGEPMAQYAVGLFYFWGDMLMCIQKPATRDFMRMEAANAKEALEWFRRSAAQGCLPSFRNAFNSQREGINGVVKDPAAALRWLETVEDKLDLRDYYRSIGIEYQGQGNLEKSMEWYRRGWEAGNATCANDIGVNYYNGINGLKKDQAEALRWYIRAAEAGSEYGAQNAGYNYYSGIGCERNYQEAYRMFLKAKDGGHKKAGYYLASCYYYGYGTNVDYDKAFQEIQHQRRIGGAVPMVLLALCYLYGRGTAQNIPKAKRLLEQEAQEGSGEAWKHLGDLYDQGIGEPENIKKAAECYQKALEAGDKSASEPLSHYKKTLFGRWKRI